MKTLLWFTFLFLFSCNDRHQSIFREVHVSTTQKGIQSLVDSFKLDYSRAKTKALQDTTVDKYNLKFFDFLSSKNIDSILVHVDTVIIQDLKITTKFHCNKDIAFQYGMNFKKEMNKSWDSIYHFMKEQPLSGDKPTTHQKKHLPNGAHLQKQQSISSLPRKIL
jgi:hypothetical protein